MAYMSVSQSYTDGFYVYFNDLQYSANTYTSFYVEIQSLSGNYLATTTTYSSSSTSRQFTTRINSYIFQPNTTYRLQGKAKHSTSNTAYNVGSSVVATTLSLPIPSQPFGFTAYSPTMNSIYAQWNGVSGATGYRVYLNGYWLTNTSSTGYTYSGLNPSTNYTVSISAYNSYGESVTTGRTVTTLNPPIPSQPSGFTAYSPTMNSIYAQWNGVSGATGYRVYLNGHWKNNVSYNSYTYSGLNPSTNYTVSISAYNSYGESVTTGRTVTTLNPPIPTLPTSFSANILNSSSIYVSWSGATNAKSYNIYRNGVYLTSTTNTYYTYTGLSNYTEYTLSVQSKNEYSTNPSTKGGVYRTKDEIKPVVSSINAVGNMSGITISYSASDSGSGVSGYDVYISGKNGSTSSLTKRKANTSSTSYTFTTDLNGYALDGGTYYVGVVAYDNSLNYSQIKTTSITIKGARPTNFSWSTTKSSGANFNITALEWNNFTKKINEFRKYRNSTNYTFTTAYTNGSFTASMYNQVRDRIQELKPSTSIPVWRNKGDTVLASDINRLVASLNSIN